MMLDICIKLKKKTHLEQHLEKNFNLKKSMILFTDGQTGIQMIVTETIIYLFTLKGET